MTDLEISKCLALAIGWKEDDIWLGETAVEVWAEGRFAVHGMRWRVFDYRDWSVIGPIAERYNVFPSYYSHINGWHAGAVVGNRYASAEADTPQKAIAMAMIGEKK